MAAEKKNKYRGGDTTETIVEIEEQSIGRNDIVDVEKKSVERKNRPKSSPKNVEAKSEPSPAKAKEKITLAKRLEQCVVFYQDERTQKIFGLILILLSAYLSIAFVSYFSSWDVDQDKVLGSRSDLFLPETKVKNWLGKFGALISHLFMYKGFGAASFIVIPVLCVFGLQKVVQRKLINIGSFNAKWVFAMVWSSLVLSYVFSDKLFFMGGGFGYFMNAKISNYVGGMGLISLLAFSMLTFLVLSINLSFKLPVRHVIEDDEEIEEEITSSFNSNSAVKDFNSSFNELKDSRLTPEEEAELLNFEIITKNVSESETKKEEIPDDIGFEVINPGDETAGSLPQDPDPDNNRMDLSATVLEVENKEPKGEPELEIAEPVVEPIAIEDENKAAKLVEQFGEYDPTLDLGSYQFPHFELLNDYGNIHSKVNQEELIANKNKILSTLKNYGIEIDKIMATVGPTVTLYEIVPAAGVRISKIKNLEDDIALSLAALGIRIIAPIPGKGTIGIEVPNQNPEMVPMKNILASEK